ELLLKELKINVEVVNSGFEAIDAIDKAEEKNEPFDFLIIDNFMDGISGLNVAKEIRREPSLSHIQIMLTTASPKEMNIDEIIQTGIEAFVHKPIRPSLMPKILSLLLDIKGSKKQVPLVTQNSFSKIEKTIKPSNERLFETLKVLIVEDFELNIIVAESIIKKYGCETFSATDGAEAVERFKNESFDIILMDCQMPVMD
ncbi:MAG: response regulator, partial [Rickettsiales bacterium]|nr:response regulator [Rickettsiales bacterium]